MKNNIFSCLTFVFIFILLPINLLASSPEDKPQAQKEENTKQEKLVVMWTSGDREVALKMVFMYTYNAKKYEWWDDITLLIWGPSAKLLTEDEELQEYVKKMKDDGIKLLACKGCADSYGISDKLEALGVTVRYTGVDLTNFIKEGYLVTF